MKLVILAATAAIVLFIAGLAAWQINAARTENAAGDQELDRIVFSGQRLPLPEDYHPSDRVGDFPTVAVVTVEDLAPSRFTTASGNFEGVGPNLIYTPATVFVDEYIKGSGEDEITVALRGGTADGITMDLTIPLRKGDQAVVFLTNPNAQFGGQIVNNAYVFNGDTATSNIDRKTFSIPDLLDGLRAAAAADASQ